MSQAGTYNFAMLETLTADVGGAIYPDAFNNINILGAGGIHTIGVPATSTITITGPAGIAGGIVATFTCDVGGPVNPTALGNVDLNGGANITTDGSVVNTVTFNLSGTTNHAVQIGNVGGSLTSLAVGATGETIMGTTGADPAWTNSPSFGGSVTAATTITATNGTLTVGNTAVDATSAIEYFKKIRGAGTIVTGDMLGTIKFSGYEGTSYIDGARITSTSSGTIALNRVAGDLKFYTHPDSVAADPTLRMTIASTGATTIAAPTSGVGLTIAGGGETITAGDLTISSGNLLLPQTTSTVGQIKFASNTMIHIGSTGADGNQNVFFGRHAGDVALTNTGSTLNIGIGNYSLSQLTTGDRNVCVGSYTGYSLTDQTYNVFIGADSGREAACTSSIGIGKDAARKVTGTNNVAVGDGSLANAICSGSYNSALGYRSLYSNTSGASNVGIGYSALNANSTGSYCVAVGYNTCLLSTGTDGITAVGSSVLANATAPTNTSAFGYQSLTAITTGTNNTALGYQSGNAITTGSDNIFIGNIAGGSCTLDDHSNIIIGNSGTAGDVHTIRIGTQGNAAGQQEACYVAGIYNTAVGVTAGVVLSDSVHKLGGLAGAAGEVFVGDTKPKFLAAGVAGSVLTSAGAGADPVWQNMNYIWVIQTVDLSPMVVNTGYIANKAGLLTLTLPAVAAVGTSLRVTGMNTDVGWRIAQAAGQTLHFGNQTTTTGAGGYLESTQMHDSVELICIVANTDWVVVSCTGNITVA